jgi:hypothetical protein
MRLELILPQVRPTEFRKPWVCPHRKCQDRHFEHHQEVDKPLKDTGYGMVSAHRSRCLRCKRMFRVYPQGVTRAQTSQRVKGLGVMLYLLGLSHGATSLALEALGVYMSKSSVHEAVQAATEAPKTDPQNPARWLEAGGGDSATSVLSTSRRQRTNPRQR